MRRTNDRFAHPMFVARAISTIDHDDRAHVNRDRGLSLLVELAKLALDRGCGRFEWSVLDWNDSAKGFYRARGAVTMGDWRIMRVTGEELGETARG